jgi:hypothetical protein
MISNNNNDNLVMEMTIYDNATEKIVKEIEISSDCHIKVLFYLGLKSPDEIAGCLPLTEDQVCDIARLCKCSVHDKFFADNYSLFIEVSAL